jgi:Surface antigen variable number repeat
MVLIQCWAVPMKKAFLTIICGSLLFLSCKPRIAQSPTSPPIAPATVTVSEIFIAGNRRVPTDTIRSQIRTQIGGPLDESTVKSDVQRIRALGEVRDVRVSYETAADGGRVVTFSVAGNVGKVDHTCLRVYRSSTQCASLAGRNRSTMPSGFWSCYVSDHIIFLLWRSELCGAVDRALANTPPPTQHNPFQRLSF